MHGVDHLIYSIFTLHVYAKGFIYACAVNYIHWFMCIVHIRPVVVLK